MTPPQWLESFFQFCPRCGRETAQAGAVPFRCGDCGFAHFFGPVAAVGALVTNDEDELLMVRRACDPEKGKWGLPGGFVDREETIEQALAREVLEETGLRVVAADYLASFPNQYNYQGMIAPVIDLFYCCQVDRDDPIRLDPQELSGFQWVRPSDATLDQMAFRSNRLAIEQWLASID